MISRRYCHAFAAESRFIRCFLFRTIPLIEERIVYSMMKKALAVAMAALLLMLSFAGCKNNETSSGSYLKEKLSL